MNNEGYNAQLVCLPFRALCFDDIKLDHLIKIFLVEKCKL